MSDSPRMTVWGMVIIFWLALVGIIAYQHSHKTTAGQPTPTPTVTATIQARCR